MKLYLCLLSLLPTVITASLTMALRRSTDIEPIEKRMAYLDVSEGQYEARGIDVEREGIESSHLLGKRLTPICSEACGKVDTNDCLATLAEAANAGKLAPHSAFCEVDSIRFFGSKCVVSFTGITHTTCISNGRLAGLVQELFNDCINDPNVATGGCFVLTDTGVVCLGNQNDIETCVRTGP
jgi:hypothetical protein